MHVCIDIGMHVHTDVQYVCIDVFVKNYLPKTITMYVRRQL